MKTFLKWTVRTVVLAVTGTIVYRFVQEGRAHAREALGRVEKIAEHTRSAVGEAEAALRDTREAI